VLALVAPDETLEVFAELGVVFLLFWVGLETRLSDMREVGAVASRVGIAGVLVPFAAGFGAGAVVGESAETSVFIGAALVATSVGITSAVLIELGVLASTAARTILGAAVIDDILAMILLAVAVGVAEQGGVDIGSISVVLALAIAFVAFVALGGTRIVARWPGVFHAPRFSESPLMPAVILCLGLAAFAAQIGLAAIIGAFLAGMVVAESKDRHDFEEEVAPLYAFFPPFFFVFIGLEVDLGAFTDGGVLLALAGSACSRRSRSSCRRGWPRGPSARATRGSSASGWCPAARWGSSSPASARRRASSPATCSRSSSGCRSRRRSPCPRCCAARWPASRRRRCATRRGAGGSTRRAASRCRARPLAGDVRADVAVVGGGYTGMWAAWHLAEAGASVALVEADLCGHGPSGRNGGFLEDMWLSLPALRGRFGDAGALAVGRAAEASVEAIAGWCEAQGVDAWLRGGGQLVVSAAPAQDGVGAAAVRAAAELGVPDRVVALDAGQVAARCASPVFRSGVWMPAARTVQPARLALGLRARLVERGVHVFERSRVRRVVDGGGVETSGGRVLAPHVVLAAGGALASFAPLRGRLTVASSHIVLTEPVPDVIERLGWTGGEAITDARALLHYFRTTRDGRIAFGWAGGRLAMGARLRGRVEVDPVVAAAAREHLLRIFPALRGRAVTHAWGGPIDIAPSRALTLGSLPSGCVHFAYGYTGNGVGPSQLAGRVLASLALDRREEWTALPLVDPPPDRRVPPEPLRWAGGSVVLAAMRRAEAAQERGERAGALTRAVAGLPRRVGVTVGR
jgi:glycine/D-amino acid oxidase-like deaminating enzyme